MIEPLPQPDAATSSGSSTPPASPRRCTTASTRSKTIDANINGLRNLLDYCVRAARARASRSKGFLFYSSSEIYGDPTPGRDPDARDYRGNVSCTGPRACYDESKRFGETLCVIFAQQYGMPIKMARPFNNYGPGLKITDGRVLPDFARDVLAGRDIVMLSDGTPTRTFCYAADAITGYYKVLVQGPQRRALQHRHRDAGDLDGRARRARDRDRRASCSATSGKVVRRPNPEADYLVDNPNRRCPNIDKARDAPRLRPDGSLIEEGMRRSLIWYSPQSRGADEA